MPVISETLVTRRLPSVTRPQLDDEVERRGDGLADAAVRELDAAHRHHRLEARQRVARRCWRGWWSSSPRGRCSWPGACRGPRSPRTSPTMIRSGRMRSAFLTRSRLAISPSPSMLAGRVSSRTTCALLQPKLGGVLDGDDALVVGDERRERVQQRRLAGAGAAADEDVEPRLHARGQEVQHLRRRATRWRTRSSGLERLGAEAADGEHRAVERERRDDGVDARAVGQARVDHRRRLVDAPADPRRRCGR